MRPLLFWVALGTLTAAASAAAQAPGARLEILADEERDELRIVIGPIDLPARTSHHALEQLPVMTGVVPVAASLCGFRTELVDGEGRPVPPGLLHHVNVIDPDHRELFLPISRRLFAAGSETGSARMPGWLLGVPLREGQRLVVSTMFHNPTDASYQDVQLRIVMRYKPEGSFWPLFQVYPFQVDVLFPVGDKSFDLPPGRSEISYEGSPAAAGRVLAVGGHLHDFAVALRFEDATSGKVLWEGKPIEDEHGHLVGVPVAHLWKRLGARIKPDHVYRVTAIYENSTGDTIRGGGMGVIGGVFLPLDSKAWPAPDPKDPLYVADFRHYMRLEGEGGEHGEHGGHGGHGDPGGERPAGQHRHDGP